jgi:hypothetical protein
MTLIKLGMLTIFYKINCIFKSIQGYSREGYF